MSKKEEKEKEIRILCLDGGGMRGLITIYTFDLICQQLGENIFDKFDLVCGTSTGGILALACGLKRKTLKEGEKIYKQLGEKVFGYKIGDLIKGIGKKNRIFTWIKRRCIL